MFEVHHGNAGPHQAVEIKTSGTVAKRRTFISPYQMRITQKQRIQCIFVTPRAHIGIRPRGYGNRGITIVFSHVERICCKVIIAEILFSPYAVAIALQRCSNTEHRVIPNKRSIDLLNGERVEIATEHLTGFFIRYLVTTAIAIIIALPPPIHAIAVPGYCTPYFKTMMPRKGIGAESFGLLLESTDDIGV